VGDDDRRRHPREQALELLDAVDVEVVGRLVEEQQVGLEREGVRQSGALALATGH
jgi:hypothetical protein